MDIEPEPLRILASGATELWADGIRQGHKLERLGDAALEAERPFHAAVRSGDRTLCGEPVADLREYPIDFAGQEPRLRCPVCDARLGNPSRR